MPAYQPRPFKYLPGTAYEGKWHKLDHVEALIGDEYLCYLWACQQLRRIVMAKADATILPKGKPLELTDFIPGRTTAKSQTIGSALDLLQKPLLVTLKRGDDSPEAVQELLALLRTSKKRLIPREAFIQAFASVGWVRARSQCHTRPLTEQQRDEQEKLDAGPQERIAETTLFRMIEALHIRPHNVQPASEYNQIQTSLLVAGQQYMLRLLSPDHRDRPRWATNDVRILGEMHYQYGEKILGPYPDPNEEARRREKDQADEQAAQYNESSSLGGGGGLAPAPVVHHAASG
jgi:hypothetical protein